MEAQITRPDRFFFERAVELAREAEQNGNLPVGAVITLEGRIIAQGKNSAWSPAFNPNRHAEIEALRRVPQDLWSRSRDMTLYTTLEPCLMCMGAILLNSIGRVVYGAADSYGGASGVIGHMPAYFEEQVSRCEWTGPACPEVCDELFDRVMVLVERRRALRWRDELHTGPPR